MIRERVKEIELGQEENLGNDRWKGCGNVKDPGKWKKTFEWPNWLDVHGVCQKGLEYGIGCRGEVKS
jgi:hypothetical protein